MPTPEEQKRLDDQKKLILPFAQRAQEVQRVEPKVAYYARMFALEQGLTIPKAERAPEITGVLTAIMESLEHDRKVVQLGTPEEDALYCENFALTVFNRADKVDRAGRADKSTAMTFYAASYFMDILRHFGEPQADVQQKQRYAAWRAAEISRAIKEGRPPAPPPEPQDDSAEETDILAELAKLEMAGSSSLPAQPPPPPPAPSGDLPSAASSSGDWGQPASSLPPPPPVAAPPGGGDDGELRLPSPPKQRPLESRPSGTVWTPPPPRRFQTFQKVLFLAEDSTAPVRGTIAKVEEGVHPQHPTYLVALPDRIASVEAAEQLAPELATGEAVQYHGPSGQSVQATIAEIDLAHWPPSYLVRLADGSYVDTTADRLQQLHVPKPRSEPTNLDGLGGGAAAAAPPQDASGGSVYPPPATAAPPPAAAAPPPAARLPPRPQPAAGRSAARTPPPVAAQPVAPLPQPVPGYQPGLKEIADAAKLSKSATSALQFEDVATAVKLLGDALALLTQPRR